MTLAVNSSPCNQTSEMNQVEQKQNWGAYAYSLAGKVTKAGKILAIPAIVLIGLSQIQAAQAGPLTYAGCVAGCEALATVATGGPGAAFIMQCIQGCMPVLYLPCP